MATFKARARAVDMLGRQQIAGIPTAINELFKNAHDAYAKNVIGDYFPSARLLVIRDDGIGMSQDEFRDKWLVVGTESKVGGVTNPPPGAPRRSVLGEKGIGRLAVAAVGPQVLVLTRAQDDNTMTLALVNWTLFEATGIDLDEVEIPIVSIPIQEVPAKAAIRSLVQDLRANVERLGSRLEDSIRRRVLSESDLLLELDPQIFSEQFVGPTMRQQSGTQFWIAPTDEMLAHDISGDPNDDQVPPPLLKMLVGFSDTMVPGNPPPPMIARFYEHKSRDFAVDVIGESEFFTPEDFYIADHTISGKFNEFGEFLGTVSVYGSDPVSHRVAWPALRGQRAACGPFSLDLAYVQGAKSASRLSPEDFNRTTEKLKRVGGLYVYRDRVRILPYGNHDFDWLEVERQRSKSASDYFWSYRRMFGVVGIDSSANSRLQEKAGREGFRANAAYRDFRDILQNFLVQTARDFFRENSLDETWRITRQELTREANARKRHDASSKQRKSSFRKELADAGVMINTGAPERDVERIIAKLEDELAEATSQADPSRAAQQVVAAEGHAEHSITELRTKYRLSRPRGVALPTGTLQDLEAYQREYEILEVNLFRNSLVEIERRSGAAARQLGSALDRRRRLEAGMEQVFGEAASILNRAERAVQAALNSLADSVSQDLREARHSVEREVRETRMTLGRVRTDQLNDQAITDTRQRLSESLRQIAEEKSLSLRNLEDRLNLIAGNSNSLSDGDIVDVIASMEQEVAALRDRADQDLELAQLGLALQVINHEFSASIRSVRTNLRRLQSWANANKSLRPVYTDLRASFEHLDAYLRLFTPLNRRLYRRGTAVKGSQIEQFLTELFQERIGKEGITLEVTSEFRDAQVQAYPSTLYPVFVNLVDNAMYWLTTRSYPRIVRLDNTGSAWVVCDNGPGIATKDRERVFELGFSRKPSGRGMGLNISRDVLRKEGWSLEIADSPLGGACFSLQEPKTTDESAGSGDEEQA